MFNEMCGYFPQHCSPAVSLKRATLFLNISLSCLETTNFHGTTLVNNSIVGDPVLSLEALPGGKRRQVETTCSPILGVLSECTFICSWKLSLFQVYNQMSPNSSLHSLHIYCFSPSYPSHFFEFILNFVCPDFILKTRKNKKENMK